MLGKKRLKDDGLMGTINFVWKQVSEGLCPQGRVFGMLPYGMECLKNTVVRLYNSPTRGFEGK